MKKKFSSIYLLVVLSATVFLIPFIASLEDEDESSVTPIISEIIDITTTKSINRSNNLDYYEGDDDDYDYSGSDSCHIDTFIDDITGKILPDDYEEGKQLEIKFATDNINETIAIVMRLHYYMQNVSERLQPYIKRIAPRFTELLPLIHLPPECLASLARIGEAAQDGQMWALKFMDSQPAFMPTGKLQGLGQPLGEYDECLSIRSPEEKGKEVIFGKYCAMGLAIPLPPKSSFRPNHTIDDRLELLVLERINATPKLHDNPLIKNLLTDDFRFKKEVMDALFIAPDLSPVYPMKVCLPSTCHPKDIEYAINKLLYPITRVPTILSPDCDYSGKPVTLDQYELIALITFGVLIILAALSTIFEIFYIQITDNSKKPSLLSRIGSSFSVISNGKQIFTTERGSSDKFVALDGVKVVFTFWGFFLQCLVFSIFMFSVQKDFENSVANQVRTSWKWMALRNWHLPEGFFMIGGCLTSYVMLTKLNQSKGNFQFFRYAFYRYMHLVAKIVGAILIIWLLPLVGDGPLWSDVMAGYSVSCHTNWNSSLLMISNYNIHYPDRLVCNMPTWYLSTDFQLYLLAPIVFLSLYYWPKFGLYFNLSLILFGAILAVLPKFLYGIPHLIEWSAFDNYDKVIKAMRHHYYGLEAHFGSYACGLLLGYLVRAKPDLYLGGVIGEFFLWVITGFLSVFSIVWQKPHYDFDFHITQTEVYLFMLFGKYMFISFWFWLIYACSTGRAGVVNSFFGWKGFKFFSNICFEFYVVRVIPIVYRNAVLRDPLRQTQYYVISIIPIDTILSIILAIVIKLLVSSPANNLMNLLIKGPLESIGKNGNVILRKKEEQNAENFDIGLNGVNVTQTK